jgi:hypothetical protein
MRHRVDLGLALAGDEWIIDHVNDVTAALWFLSRHALDHNDRSGCTAARPSRHSTARLATLAK